MDPRTLPVQAGGWETDGPALPVEFTRVSRDKRVTLAITPGAPETAVLWTPLQLDRLDNAISALADRENIKPNNTQYSVGYWSAQRASHHDQVTTIGSWAADRGIEAVVWTALKPRFMDESGRIPNVEQVIQCLDGLKGEVRTTAEQYVRRAPLQISTRYRTVIEQRLGWTHQEQQA
ncbi:MULTISPECIES: hypothetical protein [unclassified Roseitalea]|uniref:hypothetical protein n=1 Tax=unclassified Roseitalea TaxID=2639107 RepID=UPI00273E2B55|nr:MULTISPECIES: hypothetical protein [unclassified Roseitalea]